MTRWNRREFDLAERAEPFDMELRQDADGCYWLEHTNSDMHGIGPLDLDEAEDWVVAFELGMCGEQAREFAENRRWRRIHPELFEDEDEDEE